MRNIKQNITEGVFFRFLLSYVIVLSIPIIIVLFAFNKAIQITEEDAKSYSLLMLEQGRNTIDNRIIEINNMVQQMTFNKKITSLVDMDTTLGNTPYAYWDTCQELKNYKLTNNFIDSIFLTLRNGDIVISDGYTFRNIPFFYENNLKYDNTEYTQWYKNIWNNYYYSKFFATSSIIRNDKKQQVITYIQSLPIGEANSIQGAIIILIDEKEFNKLIAPFGERGGWAYIANEKGEIITSVLSNGKSLISPDKLKNMDLKNYKANDNMIIQYKISNYNGWMYAAAYPAKTLLSQVDYIKMVIYIVLLFSIIAGIFAAFLFSKKNSSPILKLIAICRENLGGEEKSNVYDFLQGSLTGLIQNNAMLKSEMKAKIPFLREAFMDRLLKGGFNTIQEINEAFMSVDMNFQYKKYIVVLVKVKGYKDIKSSKTLSELNMTKIIVSKAITEFAGDKVQIHEIEEEGIALLFCYDCDDLDFIKDDIENFSEKISQILKDTNNINVAFGAGTVFNSILEVYRSYNEAKEVMDYKLTKDERYVAWYENMPDENSLYYYPMEVENKIINLVKAGAVNEVNHILDELYDQNMNKRVLSKIIIKYLLDEMKGTVVKVVSQLKVVDAEFGSIIIEEVLNAEDCSTVNEFIAKLKIIYSHICSKSNENDEKNNGKLKNLILEYIHLEYANPEMNLSLAASKFKMNEKSFSRLFKELIGPNFSQYVEDIRLTEAKELLYKTNLTINDISQKIGYTSAHAFRRAFKRVNGILPTIIRD